MKDKKSKSVNFSNQFCELMENQNVGQKCGRFGHWILSWMPFIGVLKRYKLSYLNKDLITGFTVGVMNVPQGMAYGMLAGLDPVYGLYTTMILPCIYALFTDSHHISMGTFAIISLIVNGVIHKVQIMVARHELVGVTVHNNTNFWCGLSAIYANTSDIDELAEIAASFTMLVAIIQILLGILHFGFMASYLSMPLVKGFTTGGAMHVIISQLGQATGVRHLPVTDMPLGIIKYFGCFVINAPTINWATVTFSTVCICIIYVVKTYIDPKTRPTIKLPIPIDLTVIVIATVVTWGFQLDTKFGIATVGNIPKGLPSPKLPNLKWFQYFYTDAIALALVTYSLSVSLGKLYGNKFGYTISQNQEWFAIGFAQLFGSFFRCHPGGSSMSRSQVQSTSGGKTQVVSLISSAIILVVLVVKVQTFDYLPKCSLAAMIIVAVRKLVLQVEELPSIYRKSKIDAAIWMVACGSILVLSVTTGLAVGVVFALLTVILRQQWPSSHEIVNVDGTLTPMDGDCTVKKYEHIIILRFNAPISFVNTDTIPGMVHRKTEIVPLDEKRKRRDASKVKKKHETENGKVPEDAVTINALKFIILDCIAIPYMDIMGVEVLAELHTQYTDIDINVYFANCNSSVQCMFDRCQFYDIVPRSHIFPTVEMAVDAANGKTISVTTV